jgi:ElaB/YqjD/DUF883 family membrane-anchored ribosome-binding protein
MEQEVPVVIHEHKSMDPAEKPYSESLFPDKIKEIGDTLSEAYSSFKESEAYDLLAESATNVKEYIKKNPAQALLFALGAGALFGLLLRKK